MVPSLPHMCLRPPTPQKHAYIYHFQCQPTEKSLRLKNPLIWAWSKRSPYVSCFSQSRISFFAQKNHYRLSYASRHVCLRGTHDFGLVYAREPYEPYADHTRAQQERTQETLIFLMFPFHGHIFPYMGISSLYHPVVRLRLWRVSILIISNWCVGTRGAGLSVEAYFRLEPRVA